MTFDSDYEPWFEPPGWIIGPIWLVLYTMLAISFMMMLSKKEEISKSNLIIVLFIIQLIVNLMWPGVFNSAQYLTSFLMIIVMVIFTTIYAYVIFEPAKNASILVWPYIIWVSFAGIINFAYYLNAR
ncbi:MAG TPA: tryptophan-rich sensory protein [Candidatus Poseidoniaceae archaeon]|nr:tryptophan-rich sensory protein [Candidatus Poseidoniaceae archaeon]HII51057.1 tryptophan-rich sensory protein [Candidatus Poseidoniaceae archaeon]